MNPREWLARARTNWPYVLVGLMFVVVSVMVFVYVNRTFQRRQQRLNTVTLHEFRDRVAPPGAAAPLEEPVQGLLSVPPALDRFLMDQLDPRREWGPSVRHNQLRPLEVPLQSAPDRRGPS